MVDTITYLLSLIVFADIQKPSANAIRSLLLLGVNYLEVILELSLIVYVLFYGKIGLHAALEFGFWGVSCISKGTNYILNFGMQLFRTVIRFFFLSLSFGYFSRHLTQRKFRQLQE